MKCINCKSKVEYHDGFRSYICKKCGDFDSFTKNKDRDKNREINVKCYKCNGNLEEGYFGNYFCSKCHITIEAAFMIYELNNQVNELRRNLLLE